MGAPPVATARPWAVKLSGVNVPELAVRVVAPWLVQVISEFMRPAAMVYLLNTQPLPDFSISWGPLAASAGVMQCFTVTVFPIIILAMAGGRDGESIELMVTAISHRPGFTPEGWAMAVGGSAKVRAARVAMSFMGGSFGQGAKEGRGGERFERLRLRNFARRGAELKPAPTVPGDRRRCRLAHSGIGRTTRTCCGVRPLSLGSRQLRRTAKARVTRGAVGGPIEVGAIVRCA